MVSSLEELGVLLEQNDITPADIEFIVNFMEAENISPQLAMRRIKAFDSLKAKAESNSDQEKIRLLEEELQQVKNQLMIKREELQELKDQNTGLESEKMELETKSELLDSEREELQHQLQLIQNMKFDDEDDNHDQLDKAVIQNLKSQLVSLSEQEEIETIIQPIIQTLDEIITTGEFEFNINEYQEEIMKILKKPDTIQTISQTSSASSSTSSNTTKQIPTDDKEKLESSSTKEKLEESSNPADKNKSTANSKPSPPEKKVSEKEEQVLNLFLDFLEEADTDKGFKDRVSTICDMDEAYEYLGSIGLSQVYSFASKSIDKKEELVQLLKSWKEDGIPR